jgi:hypothetical protein
MVLRSRGRGRVGRRRHLDERPSRFLGGLFRMSQASRVCPDDRLGLGRWSAQQVPEQPPKQSEHKTHYRPTRDVRDYAAHIISDHRGLVTTVAHPTNEQDQEEAEKHPDATADERPPGQVPRQAVVGKDIFARHSSYPLDKREESRSLPFRIGCRLTGSMRPNLLSSSKCWYFVSGHSALGCRSTGRPPDC